MFQNKCLLCLIYACTLFFAKGEAFVNQNEAVENARLNLLDDLAGEWVSRSIYAVVQLGIPDLLNEGPRNDKELAKITGTNPESLFRILRMLASRGIFTEHENHCFSHTEKSRLLSKEHPSSLNSLALFYGNLIHKSWEGLQDSLQSGKPGFDEYFGQPVFRYFQSNEKDFHLFHKAMKEKSHAVIESCLNTFDFSPYASIFDIGCGKGHFLKSILARYPQIHGVFFDLPEVINEIGKEASIDSPRCKRISGDFFEEIPSGGDLYLLKSILHDWSDQKAIAILSKCRKIMRPQSRLLIIEPIVGPTGSSDYAKLMDVLMLNVTGGRERTLEDFTFLLQKSGFQMEQVHSTSTEFKMIVATPNKV